MAHADRAHATHAPSAAHRWMNCPGSVRLSRGFDDSSSVFAREGTAAHALAHHCLTTGRDAEEFRGWYIGATSLSAPEADVGPPDEDTVFTVTAEMAEAVQMYLDVVRGLVADGYEMEFEQRLSTPLAGVYGTGDAIGYHPQRRRVVIVDLKYGKGVSVDV